VYIYAIKHIIMANLLFTSNWTSIVFEGRNKFYGAFELRQSYERHMLFALFITLSSIAVLSLGTFWVKHLSPTPIVSEVIGPEVLLMDYKRDETIYTMAKPKTEQSQAVQPKLAESSVPTSVSATSIASTSSEVSSTTVGTETTTAETGSSTSSSSTNEGDSDAGNAQPTELETPANPESVTYAEVMPAFNGNMQTYIASHFNYPRAAINHNVEGKMVIELILDENGKVSKAKILRSLGFGCDEEALRVVLAMPNWQPAKVGGRAVKIKIAIPISLKLASN
jgi:protein TonB